MTQSVPDFSELLKGTQRSAVHLELRDTYAAQDSGGFAEYLRTGYAEQNPDAAFWSRWGGLVREAVGRGVSMRRARIVSEPVTDYIRYEHALTVANVALGEHVRWLPRRQASDIALPGNDFWLFDDSAVLFNHFAGDGAWAEPRLTYTEDPAVATLCATAFETVWNRSIPHEEYRPA
ncbi:DUF6879 family protein [Kitasatospora kifunensis]|uniref:DUF6879 domain-containing protein n=1 Tax=Kitasatospora kifunensis TaxID=58351 RepID=A0A7W7R3T0_KITKI|nr:DUF6879 family protein [Kitasatospora kifunensis]MBB4924937.1 hypothetical protein [Kitasatospora kifunensis]